MNKTFEETIKESLDQYSVEYNPSDWNELEKKLDQQAGASKNKSPKNYSSWLKFIGLGAAVVTILGYLYLNNEPEQKAIAIEEQPVAMVESTKPENIVSPQNMEKPVNKTPEIATLPPVAPAKKDVPAIVMEHPETAPKKEEAPAVLAKQVSNPTTQEEKPKTNLINKLLEETDFSFGPLTCAEKEILFTAQSKCSDCEYEWDFGQGQTRKGKSINYVFNNEGTFDVSLKVSHPGAQKEVSKNVTVYPLPYIDLSSKFNIEEYIPYFEFSSYETGENLSALNIRFSDGQEYDKANFKRSFKVKGNYSYTIKTTSNKGCMKEETKELYVDQTQINNLMAPTAFSPNADGIDDNWMPKALESGKYEFVLNIYDRNKGLVFTTKNKDIKWDGIIRPQGVQAKVGETYIWMAYVKSEQGIDEEFQGTITVYGK